MAKKTTTEEVKERIEAMEQKKAEELKAIKDCLTEAHKKLEEANKSLEAATESTNLESYSRAKEDKYKAKNEIEMYTNRYRQLDEKDFISEAESDQVIKGLMEYEEEIGADFKRKAGAIVAELEEVLAEYLAKIEDTENTINRWTREIHPNYINSCTTYADGTNRSPHPVPVRSLPFRGCKYALLIEEYIKQSKK